MDVLCDFCDSKILTLHMRQRLVISAGTVSWPFPVSCFPFVYRLPFVYHLPVSPQLLLCVLRQEWEQLILMFVRVKSHTQEWILLYEQLIKRDKFLFAFYVCRKMEHELIVLSVEEPENISLCIGI